MPVCPRGFKIAPEPAVLDGSLVDCAVYMRWELYGWQMGKITGLVTNATPRLIKKFNYRTSCGQTAAIRDRPSCKSNYGHRMGPTLATTLGSS